MTLEKRLRQPLKAGVVTSYAQVRDCTRISPGVAYPFFEWVPSPDGGFDLRNENRSVGSGDGHTTGSLGKDMARNSEWGVAFSWRYNAGEFEQTERNLIWQLQTPGKGSPALALSTEQRTDEWSAVSRNGSTVSRQPLGKIQWDRTAFVVWEFKIADAPNGYFKVWLAHDQWPDISQDPLISRDGMDTYQGDLAQMTLGMYAKHERAGVYVGYGRHFGRAATPGRAVELAA